MYGGYPKTVTVGGEEYEINTDFRVWAQIDELLFSGEISPERAAQILGLCYKQRLPEDAKAAFEAVIRFHAAGKVQRKNGRKRMERQRRYVSFLYDEAYISAAFFSEYNIDLSSTDMHWWRFRTLFDGLSENQKICEIINIRAADISKIKDKSARAYYSRAKSLYKLPDTRSEEEIEADGAEMLSRAIGGGI